MTEMVNTKKVSIRWMMWLKWVLASTVGFVVGIGGSLVASSTVSETIASVVFGAISGLVQWFLLRKIFRHSGWWILANVLGISLGFATTRIILWTGQFELASNLGFGLLGLMVGISQWLVLHKNFRKAGWWVLVSVVGWVAAGYATLLIIFLPLPEFIAICAGYAISGIIVGVFTGLMLIFLKKFPRQTEAKRGSQIGYLIVSGCAVVLILIVIVFEGSDNSLGAVPDLGLAPICNNLPSLECNGDDAYCTEIVPFEPTNGPGYINYPVNGETWDEQYRSYLRRDLMMVIKYASAKVMCMSEGWDYHQFEILGLGDMSEMDGAIPGTSEGNPGHPLGTHQDGNDIDVAYYQMDIQSAWPKLRNDEVENEGNLLDYVCKYTKFGINIYHCTEPPYLLDPWRTALFIAYLAEHPNLRVIGVDGQVGPVVEKALGQLVQVGWIDADLREQIPLAYETTNENKGWFLYHHHHLHISMQEK